MGSLGLAARSAVARLSLTAVFAAAWLVAAALFGGVALAAGPHLKLVETKLDPTNNQYPVVSDGAIKVVDPDYGNYEGNYTWTSPPSEMDGSGGTIPLNVTASAKAGGGLATGLQASGNFEFENDLKATEGIWAHAGESKSASATIHFAPASYLSAGEFVELKVSVFYGGGVVYRYQVVGVDDGYTNTTSSQNSSSSVQSSNLAAQVDCPSDITIGAPPLNCHLIISGFRHNTADAVSVRLPLEKDGFGNHDNGIQVFNTEGEQDVFNMDDPYSWGFFVIACPTDANVGGNCYDFKATPGTPATVQFEVCQENSGCITANLTFNVLGKAGGPTPPPAIGATHYIGNRWAAGGFLNIENGSPQTGWIKLDWLSARWSFEQVPNTTYYRIRNAWHGDYLNVEHGQLEVGPIDSSWQSAMWQFFPAPDNPGYQLIGNVWRPELYLTAQQNISVVAAPVDKSSYYAHWWVLD